MDEPSKAAMSLMGDIEALRCITLTPEDIDGLSQYERLTLAKAARKRGYVGILVNPDSALQLLVPSNP